MKNIYTLLIAVAVIAACIMFLMKPLPKPQAADVPETPSQKAEETHAAFTNLPGATGASDAAAGTGTANATPADNSPERQAIDAHFTALGKAFQSGNGSTIGAHFDYELMFDLLERQGVMPNEAKKQRESIVQALRQGLGSQFAAAGSMMAWNSHEIRALRWLKDDRTEAVVYLRTASVLNAILKYRWWVANRNGAWRTYDLEDLSSNVRISTMMGIGFAAGMRKEPWAAKMPQVMQASQAVAAGDVANADLMLKQLEGISYPPMLDALRLMLTGAVRLQQGKWQEAIDAADLAENYNPGAPTYNQMRAAAYVELKQPEKALACTQKYIDLLGADADILSQVGLARAQMGQAKEAEQAFVDGLKDDPQSFFCMLQYAKFLPKERKGEIAAHFAKAKDPDDMLERLGKTLSVAQDADTLLAVCAAYRAAKPDSGKEKQYEKVAELLRNAVPSQAPETKTAAPSE